MKRMKLIGLAGPAGCGKSEAAQFIAQHFGWGIHAFADPLKRMVASLLNVTSEEFERRCQDRAFKESPILGLNKSPRQLLQTLGTEWGREMIHPDVWLVMTQLQVFSDEWMNRYPGVVIQDVRFENEANWLRLQGGLLVHIRREGIDAVAAHSSEKGVDQWAGDAVINNDADICALHNKIFHLVDKYSQEVA